MTSPSRRSIELRAHQLLERPHRVGGDRRRPDEDLELAMRFILRLFADGALVYRVRELRLAVDLPSTARRVRLVRAAATA